MMISTYVTFWHIKTVPALESTLYWVEHLVYRFRKEKNIFLFTKNLKGFLFYYHFIPYPAKLIYLNVHPFEVVGRGNFKWLKITHICLILAQLLANLDV